MAGIETAPRPLGASPLSSIVTVDRVRSRTINPRISFEIADERRELTKDIVKKIFKNWNCRGILAAVWASSARARVLSSIAAELSKGRTRGVINLLDVTEIFSLRCRCFFLRSFLDGSV